MRFCIKKKHGGGGNEDILDKQKDQIEILELKFTNTEIKKFTRGLYIKIYLTEKQTWSKKYRD